MTDGLGDRMKRYEAAEAGRRLMPLVPVLARLDGRAFHSFVRGLGRPFDPRLSALMIDTATVLVRETNATIGYTQSDEITLAWVADGLECQPLFDGRAQKLTSVLAALGTAHFNRRLPAFLPPEYADRVPVFDCRVWNVPTLDEAANAFLWRERDATRDSLAMAARACYEHSAVHGKNRAELHELLWQRGVNWNDYPSFFRRGTYIRTRKVARPFTAQERDQSPEKHAARGNPALVVERSECGPIELPPLVAVENRTGVLFRGEVARTRAAAETGNRPDGAGTADRKQQN